MQAGRYPNKSLPQNLNVDSPSIRFMCHAHDAFTTIPCGRISRFSFLSAFCFSTMLLKVVLVATILLRSIVAFRPPSPKSSFVACRSSFIVADKKNTDSNGSLVMFSSRNEVEELKTMIAVAELQKENNMLMELLLEEKTNRKNIADSPVFYSSNREADQNDESTMLQKQMKMFNNIEKIDNTFDQKPTKTGIGRYQTFYDVMACASFLLVISQLIFLYFSKNVGL
jgi:hypothetical protein